MEPTTNKWVAVVLCSPDKVSLACTWAQEEVVRAITHLMANGYRVLVCQGLKLDITLLMGGGFRQTDREVLRMVITPLMDAG